MFLVVCILGQNMEVTEEPKSGCGSEEVSLNFTDLQNFFY